LHVFANQLLYLSAYKLIQNSSFLARDLLSWKYTNLCVKLIYCGQLPMWIELIFVMHVVTQDRYLYQMGS